MKKMDRGEVQGERMNKEEIIESLQEMYTELVSLEEGGALAYALQIEIEKLYHLLNTGDEISEIPQENIQIFLGSIPLLEKEFRRRVPQGVEGARQKLEKFLVIER